MSIPARTTMCSSCLSAAILAALCSPLSARADDAPAAGPQAVTLDAIEVHGVRDAIASERALTPGAVSVVDGETFYQRSVDNMADALRYVPGVWTESTTGGDAIFISSRGSNLDATDYDNNGVKLFQDGLPVSTADGNNHNRFMDPLAARHAIIARGANALTYGASTLGGAIDFVSPTVRNSPPRQVVPQWWQRWRAGWPADGRRAVRRSRWQG
jgi:iron complex outermembrane receptor protein